MSDLETFDLFQLLCLELRLHIWSLAFVPCIIPLEAEGYGEGEDPTAIPYHIIMRRHPPGPQSDTTRGRWAGRFVPSLSYVPSHAVFQVSQEPRNHAFFLGYRMWKMQKRDGLVRNFIWNPGKDFVLFPCSSLEEQLDSDKPFVHPHGWLRMFRYQYPMEASIVQNVAMYTSLWHRGTLQYLWVVDQLFKLKGMRRLTIVIDKDYERSNFKFLYAESLSEDIGGSWKLPHAIVESLETIKDKSGKRRKVIPEVRLLDNSDGILTSSPGLETTLRCNPCEYFRLEEMVSETA